MKNCTSQLFKTTFKSRTWFLKRDSCPQFKITILQFPSKYALHMIEKMYKLWIRGHSHDVHKQMFSLKINNNESINMSCQTT